MKKLLFFVLLSFSFASFSNTKYWYCEDGARMSCGNKASPCSVKSFEKLCEERGSKLVKK